MASWPPSENYPPGSNLWLRHWLWGGGSSPCRGPGLESRSRLLWQSLGLVSKFEPGLGLGGCGLDYITASLKEHDICGFGVSELIKCLGVEEFSERGPNFLNYIQ